MAKPLTFAYVYKFKKGLIKKFQFLRKGREEGHTDTSRSKGNAYSFIN